MGIGVEQRSFVDHDAHMPLPECEIVPLQGLVVVHPCTEHAKLGPRVPRSRDAGTLECELHECRAVESGSRASAIEIGSAEEAQGDASRIESMLPESLQMEGRNPMSVGRPDESFLPAFGDRESTSQPGNTGGFGLRVRFQVEQRGGNCHPVRGLRLRGPQCGCGDETRIGIKISPAGNPPGAAIEGQETLAAEKFRLQRSARIRLRSKRCRFCADLQ